MSQVLHVTEKGHKIVRGANGHIYCSCPAWRFQKVNPLKRSCKHLVAFAVAIASGQQKVA